MKLIIVDDEIAALNNFLGKIVDDASVEYTMFNKDPVLSVYYTEKNKVDAAFLDIQMDAVNGVTLAEQLIAVRPAIKIVFVSGFEQDEDSIRERIGDALLGFCYKPYTEEQLSKFIRLLYYISGQNQVFIRTFGCFDLFIGNIPVKFYSAKSKELLALMVDKRGAVLQLGEAVAMLWQDKNAEKGKVLYRDAVWRLRLVLKEHHLEHLVTFSRGQSNINMDYVKCDYWDFIDSADRGDYAGSYMPNYDWSIDTQVMLDKLL